MNKFPLTRSENENFHHDAIRVETRAKFETLLTQFTLFFTLDDVRSKTRFFFVMSKVFGFHLNFNGNVKKCQVWSIFNLNFPALF